MIEVSGLTKTYGTKRGINDPTFKINEGEIVGFLGPNGAGKSTTMNIVTGYLSATSGSARVADIDILDRPIEAKRHIGYLPEHPPLYLDMTVNEYLNFICDLKGVKSNRKAHVDNICEMVGITQVRSRVMSNLSKGYKQRCGLAQAMIGDPDVLVLDEPTVGLDPIQIIEIRNVIKDLGKKRTVILSSHILSEVQAICERVLVINHGKIIANDTPANLSQYVDIDRKMQIRVAGPQAKVQQVLERIPEMDKVIFEGVLENDTCDFILEPKGKVDVRKLVFNALAQAGMPMLMFTPMAASLEDIFIKLTAEDDK